MRMMEQSESSRMSAEEDRLLWTRTETAQSDGIVLVTAWLLSKPRQLRRYTRFYASCNWDTLACHPKVFNLWFPELAKTLALQIVDELVQELQKWPRPVVFNTFSGGYMACMWKIFQILQGTCEGVDSTLEKYKVVRDCYAGQIHDSSPADFVSKIGARFLSHPTTLGTRRRIAPVTWAAHTVAKVLDFFYLQRFSSQNIEMWATLRKSGAMGPIMILCSKADELSPYDVIERFCSQMTDLGCKVTLIAWEDSPHLDHFGRHTDEYKDAVRNFLDGAKTRDIHGPGHQSAECQPADPLGSNHVAGTLTIHKTSAGWDCVGKTSSELQAGACLLSFIGSRL